MAYNRKGYAPWSLTREAGVQSATVDGTVDVPQYIQPTLSTGFIDEKGNWQGTKSDDEVFFAFTKAESVPGGTTFLTPDTSNVNHLDMTGFRHFQIAIKCSRSINIKMEALLGPDTDSFANLSPVASGSLLKFANQNPVTTQSFDNVLRDTSEAISSAGWNIFTILDRATGQKNMVIRIGNEDASAADFEVAYRRLV
tara:strand:- start:921 stop:1511 length:591 start_codon:yes stop_codon:yes gene_type:complete